MDKEFRRFKTSFLERMRTEAAWPSGKRVRTLIRNNGGTIRSGDYEALQTGRAIAARKMYYVVEALIKFAASAREDEAHHTKRVLLGYFREWDKHVKDDAPVAAAVELLCDPVVGRLEAKHESDREDMLQKGLGVLFDVLAAKRRVTDHVQACCDEKTVRRAVEWSFVSHGRRLGTPGESSELQPAINRAERHLHLKMADFQRRAVAWWRVHPWIVVMARGKENPTGISVIVPVKRSVYLEMLDGKRLPWRCDEGDIVVPSRWIVVLVISERPVDMKGEHSKAATGSLFRCILAQIAVLSRCSDPPYDQLVNLLSFATSPIAARRLEAFGYRKTGTVMIETGFPFMQRQLNVKTTLSCDMPIAAVMRHLSDVVLGPPEP